MGPGRKLFQGIHRTSVRCICRLRSAHQRCSPAACPVSDIRAQTFASVEYSEFSVPRHPQRPGFCRRRRQNESVCRTRLHFEAPPQSIRLVPEIFSSRVPYEGSPTYGSINAGKPWKVSATFLYQSSVKLYSSLAECRPLPHACLPAATPKGAAGRIWVEIGIEIGAKQYGSEPRRARATLRSLLLLFGYSVSPSSD